MVESSYCLDLVVLEGIDPGFEAIATRQHKRHTLNTRLSSWYCCGNFHVTNVTTVLNVTVASDRVSRSSPCSVVPYRNDYAELGRRSLLSLIGSPSIKSFLRWCCKLETRNKVVLCGPISSSIVIWVLLIEGVAGLRYCGKHEMRWVFLVSHQ